MTATAEQLLREFDALPEPEKVTFAQLFWRKAPLIDSGEITDEELCAGGNMVAAMLDAEEAHEAEAR
jgi:hypothetical protein